MNDLILFTHYNKDLGSFKLGDLAKFSIQISNNSKELVKIDCTSKCACTTFEKTSSQKYKKELEPFSHHWINGSIDTSNMHGRVKKSFDLIYYDANKKEVISTNVYFELKIE